MLTWCRWLFLLINFCHHPTIDSDVIDQQITLRRLILSWDLTQRQVHLHLVLLFVEETLAAVE